MCRGKISSFFIILGTAETNAIKGKQNDELSSVALSKMKRSLVYLLPSFLLQINSVYSCYDYFNVDAKVKVYQEKVYQRMKIYGCIEGKQEVFKGQPIDSIIIKNEHVPAIMKDSIRHMGRLRKLEITNCGSQSIHPETFRNLNRLNEIVITENNITEIVGGTFTRGMPVKILNLKGNHIQVISGSGFSDMPNLEKIFLSYNELTKFNKEWFSGTNNLKWLEVSHNKIQTIEGNSFTHIKSLTDVNFEFNEISAIRPNAFRGLTKLNYLILRNNKLHTFSPDIFGEGLVIQKLYLNANRLNFLPEALLDVVKVNGLALAGNPMLCNCLNSVQAQLKATNGSIVTPKDCKSDILPTCVYPKVLTVRCLEMRDEESTKEYFNTIKTLPTGLNVTTCFNI